MHLSDARYSKRLRNGTEQNMKIFITITYIYLFPTQITISIQKLYIPFNKPKPLDIVC